MIFLIIAGSYVIVYCGFQVHILSNHQENIKKDYMIMNSVSFGLLSVDKWRDNIIAAAKSQVRNFQLTPQQKHDLKAEIEQILQGVVDKAVASIEKPSNNVGKKIKKLAFNVLVDEKKLHQQVPAYAQKAIDEINKPASYNRLKSIAQTELDSLGSKTYDSTKNAETHLMDSIFAKYGVPDKSAFDSESIRELERIRKQTYNWAFGMLGGVVMILFTWWLARNVSAVHAPLYAMSIVSALFLLAVGLTSTMIQIDARIASIDFHLLGQNVSFKNQVLYFQSKSIVDVVHILIQTGKIDTVIVGILILIFSIVFPIIKMIASGVYMMDKQKWAKNRFIRFFAFESGKWSMADVFVIAILMTYIGFNGIVNNSLSDLNMDNGAITSITTNNTSVQPGYIIFIGFVLYSFILSYILQNISHLRHVVVVDKK